MKKQLIFPVFATLFALSLLSACGNNAENSVPTSQTGTGTSKSGDTDNKNTATQATVTSNMLDAFKGETTASAKYAAYSKKAMEEGYPQIAMLFRATSAAENIHANNHKAVLEDLGVAIPVVTPEFTVKTTQENLQDALAGESYEISTMYPEFMANAKSAGTQMALISLNYAYRTEQKHKAYYEKAIAALQNNQVNTMSMSYYVCPTCGNTFDGVLPKRCEISMTSSSKFIEISKV